MRVLQTLFIIQKCTPAWLLVGCVPILYPNPWSTGRTWGWIIERMSLLGDKLGPMVFQFPSFDRWKFPKQESFLAVLTPFLKKLPADHKFVIEIRNKTWLDATFAELLRDHNVALALTDTSFVPRPWETEGKFDMITADFAYVRWFGMGYSRSDQGSSNFDPSSYIDRASTAFRPTLLATALGHCTLYLSKISNF